MVVKGIIKTIDFNSNSCTVRLPYFENAGNEDEVVVNAIFSTVPGIYNGYKVDDVVFVDFEDNNFNKAIVTGKLYLGASEEGNNSRSAFNISNLTVDGTATIPITTKLSFAGNNETTVGVENDLTTYKSIEDIARNLQKQETQIGSINAQFIDTGDSIGARVSKLEKDDTRHEAEIIANAEEISNKVSTTSGEVSEGLGWNLTSTEWNLTRYYTDPDTHEDKEVKVLEATKDGLKIEGEISATTGEIGGFTIDTTSIHTTGKESYNSNVDGVYLGTDGIGLGQGAFYVTKNGQIYVKDYATETYANSVGTAARTYSDNSTVSVAYQLADKKNTTTYSPTAPEGNKEGDCWFCTGYYDVGTFSTEDDYVDYFYKDGNNYIKVTELNKGNVTPGTTHAYDHNILLQYSANTWHIISNDIIAEKVTAKTINALNITARQITVTDGSYTVLHADADNPADTQIGGFKVEYDKLSVTDGNQSVIVSPNGLVITDGDSNFSVTPNGALSANDASISGTISADSLSLHGVPMNTYNENISGQDERFSVEFTSIGNPSDNPVQIKYKVKCTDINGNPLQAQGNRIISGLLTITYQGSMGGTSNDTVSVVVNLDQNQTESLEYVYDWYHSNSFWFQRCTLDISPTHYSTMSGDFKNEYGYFLDKNGCCTQSYAIDCASTYLYASGYHPFEAVWGTYTSSYANAWQNSGDTVYRFRLIRFNITNFLASSFSKVYGVSLQLVPKRHVLSPDSEVSYTTVDTVANLHKIAFAYGNTAWKVDAITGLAYFVPTSGTDSANMVWAYVSRAPESSGSNRFGFECDFKEYYNSSYSCLSTVLLTVYGEPKKRS